MPSTVTRFPSTRASSSPVAAGLASILKSFSSGFALLLAGIACACNPFDSFAECDYRNRDVEPGEVVEGLDVDAKIASLLQEHSGTITWLQLEGPRQLTLALERPTEAKAQLETDCDGQLEGFSVELVTRVASEDGLTDAFGSASLQLDKTGEAKPFASTKRKYPLDFDQLKAAGATRYVYDRVGTVIGISEDTGPKSVLPWCSSRGATTSVWWPTGHCPRGSTFGLRRTRPSEGRLRGSAEPLLRVIQRTAAMSSAKPATRPLPRGRRHLAPTQNPCAGELRNGSPQGLPQGRRS